MVHTLALALFLDSLFPVDIRGPEEGGGWMVMCAPVPLRDQGRGGGMLINSAGRGSPNSPCSGLPSNEGERV